MLQVMGAFFCSSCLLCLDPRYSTLGFFQLISALTDFIFQPIYQTLMQPAPRLFISGYSHLLDLGPKCFDFLGQPILFTLISNNLHIVLKFQTFNLLFYLANCTDNLILLLTNPIALVMTRKYL